MKTPPERRAQQKRLAGSCNTSYYASKLIAPSGLVPVRTSLGHPRWKLPYDLSERCTLLMPMRSMLGLEEAAYRERYRELLGHRGLD
jgi:hypothetical protein